MTTDGHAMTTDELVSAASPLVGGLGWAFYFAPATVQRGQELGLDQFQFYFLGRGGVLGDVQARVVASAFGYFNPAVVEALWDAGRQVVSPRQAGREFLACAAEHGRAHLSGMPDLPAFCAALQAVVDAADPTGLPLFAAASAEPLVDDLAGRAMQLVSVARELRGSAHLLAVVASDLAPKVAHFLQRPDAMEMFGWPPGDLPAVTDVDRQRLAEAEQLTDRLVRPAFDVLDADGRSALLAGLRSMAALLEAPTIPGA